ncbi:MAG: hypothetical protein ACK5XH_11060 [Lysobacteraceae bacterium]
MVRTGGGSAAKRIGLQVEIDALRLLYRQARPVAAMSVLLGVLYTWLMWPRADPSMLAVWFALLLVAALVRAVLFLRWWHRRPSGVSILRGAGPSTGPRWPAPRFGGSGRSPWCRPRTSWPRP